MFQFIIISVLCYSLLPQSSAQDLRLAGGLNRCQGRLEVTSSFGYARACNRIIGSNEAQVICRELGCEPEGASRSTHPEVYGITNSITVFGILCTGSEERVSQCRSSGGLCLGDDPDFVVAIECGGQINTYEFTIAFSVVSAVLVIISLLIVIGLIYYLITIRQLLSSVCYKFSSIWIISVEITLLLTSVILLIVFATPNQRGVFLAIASLVVSVVTIVWIVVLTPILITVIRKGQLQMTQTGPH